MPTGTSGHSPDPGGDGARSRARIGCRSHLPVEDPTTLMDASALQLLIPIAGITAVLFALYLARDVLSRDTGTPEMQAVAGTIREGADAFVRRQYTTIAALAIVGAVIIGIVIAVVETPDVADVRQLAGAPIGVLTAIAFLVGAICSMASGIIGMFISVRSNVRTASAARRSARRGRPGGDAGWRRFGLPRRLAVAPWRVGHLHALLDARRRHHRRRRRHS